MNKVTIVLNVTVLVFSSCVDNYSSKEYLNQVLNELEKIESAKYWLKGESWNPGDTNASNIVYQYVESYKNPSDTTIGSSWAIFETEEKTHLEFAYDGKMRALINELI